MSTVIGAGRVGFSEDCEVFVSENGLNWGDAEKMAPNRMGEMLAQGHLVRWTTYMAHPLGPVYTPETDHA